MMLNIKKESLLLTHKEANIQQHKFLAGLDVVELLLIQLDFLSLVLEMSKLLI